MIVLYGAMWSHLEIDQFPQEAHVVSVVTASAVHERIPVFVHASELQCGVAAGYVGPVGLVAAEVFLDLDSHGDEGAVSVVVASVKSVVLPVGLAGTCSGVVELDELAWTLLNPSLQTVYFAPWHPPLPRSLPYEADQEPLVVKELASRIAVVPEKACCSTS